MLKHIFCFFLHFYLPLATSFLKRIFPQELPITSNLVSIGTNPVGVNQNGDFIAVWSDTARNGSQEINTIVGQIYSGESNKIGSQITIASSDIYLLQNPSVAFQKDGAFMVVWESSGQDGDGSGIFGQNFQDFSNKRGEVIQINQIIAGDQASPIIVYAGQYYIVAWETYSGSSANIYAQILDGSNNERVSSNDILISEGFEGKNINIFIDSFIYFSIEKKFIFLSITWENIFSQNKVLSRFIECNIENKNITLFEAIILANSSDTTTKRKPKHSLCYYDTQAAALNSTIMVKIVVTWQTLVDSYLDIKAQIIIIWFSYGQLKLDIVFYGENINVTSFLFQNRSNPSVSLTKNYGFFISWQAFQQDGDLNGIFGQIFNHDGTKNYSEFEINEMWEGDQRSPIVKMTEIGDLFVCWTSENFNSSGISVNFQRFSYNPISAKIRFFYDEIALESSISGNFLQPKVKIFEKQYSFVVVWADDIIYFQVFNTRQYQAYHRFVVNMSNTTDLNIEDLSMDNEENSFIIIWRNFYQNRIYFQIFDILGFAKYYETFINENISNITRYSPVVKRIKDQDRSFLAAWIEQNGTTYTIMGRYFAWFPEPYPIFTMNEKSYLSISNLTLSTDGESEISLGWNAEINDENNKTIHCLVIAFFINNSTSILKKTGDIIIFNASEPEKLVSPPSLGMDSNPTNPCSLAFEYKRDIYLIMVDRHGQKASVMQKVNIYQRLTQASPVLTVNPYFMFLSWMSELQDSDGFGIYGALFDFQGNQLKNEFKINSEILSNQINPSIDSDSLGEVVVTWYSTYSNQNKAQKIVRDYQADLSNSETIGLQTLNQLHPEDSICGVFSEDGKKAIIAISNGIIKFIDLEYLLIVNELKVSNYPIVAMDIKNNIVFVGVLDALNNIVVVNTSDFIYPTIINNTNNTVNFTIGNDSNSLIFVGIYNERLYIGYEYTIAIYNISNPSEIYFLSSWEPYGKIETAQSYMWSFSLNKFLLIYVDYSDNIYTIDTENISNFSTLSHIQNSVYTYHAIMSQDKKYCYYATKTGLEIYEILTNYSSTLINIVSLSKTITHLFISSGGQYLSAMANYGHYIFSIKDPSNPVLLNFYLSYNQIKDVKITPDNRYLAFFAKGGTFLQKVIFLNKFLTPYLEFAGYQLIPSPSYDFLSISPQNNFVYGSSSNGSIFTFNISGIVSGQYSSSIPKVDKIYGNEENITLHVFDSEGLKIFMVEKVGLEPILMGKLNLGYNDYIISSKKNYIYVVSYENSTTILKIIDIQNSKNPYLQNQTNLIYDSSYSYLAFANTNESEIFITIQDFGILLKINVTNSSNLEITQTFQFTHSISLIKSLKENVFVISSNERVYIYEFSNNVFNQLSSFMTSGTTIYGIETLNETYIFAMTSLNLTLIDVRNLSSPIALDNIELQSQIYDYRSIIASQETQCIFIAAIEIYCLFGSLSNYLYPDLTINPNNQDIQFLLSFWPVNLLSDYSLKLIKVIGLENLNWVKTDYSNFKVELNPKTYYDLKSILQPLEAIFTTKIIPQELTTYEIEYLKIAGYLDENNYITEKFNVSQSMSTDDSNVSMEKIKFVFLKHYYDKKYYFLTDSFSNLIPKTLIRYNIQDQINKNTNNGQIQVDSDFTFYFSTATARNYYKTISSYSVENLPSFLEFDSTTLRISGTPNISHVGNYTINISIFDGYHYTNDSFILRVEYYPPILNPNISLQSQMSEEPEVELESQYFLDKKCFIDPNNNTLSYSATMNNQILPTWVQFDENNLLLIITPTDDTFEKKYTIDITATNKHYSVSGSITFTVRISWIYALKLLAQIVSPLLTIIGCIKYRSNIYNMLFRKYYEFSPDLINVDAYFEKEIYFISKDLEIAEIFWKDLLKSKKFEILSQFPVDSQDFQENLAKELKEISKTNTKVMRIDQELLEKNGTLYTICEGFFYHKLLKNNKTTRILYMKMKKNLQITDRNMWYRPLVKFAYYLKERRNLNYQKFPIRIIYNKENIEKHLKSSLSKNDDLNSINMALLYAFLKIDALGIPEKSRKCHQVLEYSRGESCYLESFELQEISANRQNTNKEYSIEVYNNIKLPYWMNFKIKYNILIFYGTPPLHDIGTFKIKICNKSGFIIRKQVFTILPPTDSPKIKPKRE